MFRLLTLLSVFMLVTGCTGGQVEENTTSSATDVSTTQEMNVAQDEAAMEDVQPTVEFTLEASNFQYAMGEEVNPELKVKVGDVVKITLNNVGGFHDLQFEGLDAEIEAIQEGTELSVTFVADAAGEFPYYCSIGRHRQNGMEGMLIVE